MSGWCPWHKMYSFEQMIRCACGVAGCPTCFPRHIGEHKRDADHARAALGAEVKNLGA